MLSRLSSFSGPLSKLFTAIKGFTLNGLILRYEISDNDSYSGSNTVTDLVGNSNATLVNGVTFSNTNKGCLLLDGINDYISLPQITQNQTFGNYSFSIWFSPNINITPSNMCSLSISFFQTPVITFVFTAR
jgi:hypothetical protein